MGRSVERFLTLKQFVSPCWLALNSKRGNGTETHFLRNYEHVAQLKGFDGGNIKSEQATLQQNAAHKIILGGCLTFNK